MPRESACRESALIVDMDFCSEDKKVKVPLPFTRNNTHVISILSVGALQCAIAYAPGSEGRTDPSPPSPLSCGCEPRRTSEHVTCHVTDLSAITSVV